MVTKAPSHRLKHAARRARRVARHNKPVPRSVREPSQVVNRRLRSSPADSGHPPVRGCEYGCAEGPHRVGRCGCGSNRPAPVSAVTIRDPNAAELGGGSSEGSGAGSTLRVFVSCASHRGGSRPR